MKRNIPPKPSAAGREAVTFTLGEHGRDGQGHRGWARIKECGKPSRNHDTMKEGRQHTAAL